MGSPTFLPTTPSALAQSNSFAPYQPMFLWPSEYSKYGLPNSSQQPDIDNFVQSVSGMVDKYCGRVDSDGNGSLVYSTYTERLLNQAPGRNIMLLPMKPLQALVSDDISLLQTWATSGAWQQAVLGLSVTGNFFYTGCLPSINILADGRTSAIIGASGWYSYQRRDVYPLDHDPYGIINPLNQQTFFGGPPPWIAIDMVNMSYDERTGELWYAAGQWLERYTEILVQYTSGFNPLAIPATIKQACASAVKNMLGMGGGATGLTSFRQGKASVEFGTDLLDDNIKRQLESFTAARAY